MKKLSTLLLVIMCSTLVACNNGQKINGHNTNTAFKSVKMIKNRLPTETRLEYEIAFGVIRDAKKDDKEFLSAVDDQIPEGIIALGKEIYQQRKNEGYASYADYSSWEDMISKFGKERTNQDKVKNKRDMKDSPKDNVLYKL
jgi:hypothetical protein